MVENLPLIGLALILLAVGAWFVWLGVINWWRHKIGWRLATPVFVMGLAVIVIGLALGAYIWGQVFWPGPTTPAALRSCLFLLVSN